MPVIGKSNESLLTGGSRVGNALSLSADVTVASGAMVPFDVSDEGTNPDAPVIDVTTDGSRIVNAGVQVEVLGAEWVKGSVWDESGPAQLIESFLSAGTIGYPMAKGIIDVGLSDTTFKLVFTTVFDDVPYASTAPVTMGGFTFNPGEAWTVPADGSYEIIVTGSLGVAMTIVRGGTATIGAEIRLVASTGFETNYVGFAVTTEPPDWLATNFDDPYAPEDNFPTPGSDPVLAQSLFFQAGVTVGVFDTVITLSAGDSVGFIGAGGATAGFHLGVYIKPAFPTVSPY